ncbi:type VII secretion integral membrane protein EccD [Mycobacteroides abscessus]|uniref:type VII secretion integral membrane protein EccD n=1 Tax=Mycobacteroides abscessus TaxID=36809 RepID=UPI00092A8C22|nr:type VII secretion integral membrane protein EccD [Mycobacteroides abscessus]MBN7483442.1 type VII secretion integral membrane protein EccD [Mycobacteroides abscessus subsp. massiliense]MDO3103887.1 type VII secretion integral membrane protein EccD [Mycobacteroides abscessus subsp. abscessus]MDO3338756.1 type VII secretion integral membrane protein EccD [Mycobacteroides abscessus subsp. abscessus]QOF27077.1 type VII secretion integral membrane protein EccD [Mycobacteroides abscessus]RIQ9725
MTLPPSLADLEPDGSSEPELTRVTLLVGGLQLDVGLPPNLSVSAFIGDVIDIANRQLRVHDRSAEVVFDNTDGRWSLAKLGAAPVDPAKSLAEADIYDGDVLALREVGRVTAPILFDDIEAAGEDSVRRPSDIGVFLRNRSFIAYFGTALVCAVVSALLIHRQAENNPWAGVASIVCGAILLIALSVLAFKRVDNFGARSLGLAVVATPLVAAGILYVVPNGHGLLSLPLSFSLTALISLFTLQISREGRTFHTFVIVVSILGGAASLVYLFARVDSRAIGAVLATVSVFIVYVSPRLTIALSKLPIPRVPTAGEPLDDIETQGGTTVEGVNAIGKQVIPTEEGMVIRVNRANQYLSGILAAAALAGAVGAYLAVDVSDGFFWQGVVFAGAVAAVFCLRGRSHHDVAQSATLIGAGMVTGVAVLSKLVVFLSGWETRAVVGLIALVFLIIACGVIAPRLEFSPVMRRWVELLEYAAIASVIPLSFWIIGLYAFARDMRI